MLSNVLIGGEGSREVMRTLISHWRKLVIMIKFPTIRKTTVGFGVLASAAAAIALLSAPSQAQVFTAVAGFNASFPNPASTASQFRFGFSSGVNGAFTQYNTATSFAANGSTFDVFRTSTSTNALVPFIGVNRGPNVALGTAVGQLAFHTGPDAANTNSVLQFIAPSLGSYNIASQFFAGDSGPGQGQTDVTIFLNGNTLAPLFSSATTSNNPTFNQTLLLNTGDTLSFSIGLGGDGFNFDTTPANITITRSDISAVAPEPASAALLLPVVAGGLAVVRRRRAAK